METHTITPHGAPLAYGQYAGMTSDQKRTYAHERLRKLIEDGGRTARAGVQRIMDEAPVDHLVRSQAITVLAEEGNGNPRFDLVVGNHGGSPVGQALVTAAQPVGSLHDHALGQVAQRFGFNGRYMSELRSSAWGRELIAHNLNQLGEHQPPNERLIVREVGGVMRGVMSNGYRTDDSRPALDALIGMATELKAVIVGCSALDTRTSLKVMVGDPVEIFDGEWAVFGLDYRNSDYGHGAREVLGWVDRLACFNGAVFTTGYRRVHIGARATDEVEYSRKTRKLNADFTASATRDMAKALLGPDAIRKTVDRCRAANATPIDPQAALQSIRKEVTKAEEKAIVEKYNSPDIELLPPGNTKWRFSNAISWLAGETTDGSRKLDLERLAGTFLEAVQ